VIQTKSEECVRDGATYRVETSWDDETGCADIREYSLTGELVRRCDWRIWPKNERREGQDGGDLVRRFRGRTRAPTDSRSAL